MNRSRLTALASAICCLAIACIQRNNPWDPDNYHPAPVTPVHCAADSTAALRKTADSLARAADSITAAADPCMTGYVADSLANARILDANARTVAANIQRQKTDDSIDSRNRTAPPESLSVKALFDSLNVLTALPACSTETRTRQTLVENVRLSTSALFSAFTASCPNDADSIAAFRDSAQNRIAADLSLLASALHRADSLNRIIADTNAIRIAPYNAAVVLANAAISHYNDSIGWVALTAHRPVISRADTLQSRLNLALAGDTLFLSGGKYRPTGGLRIGNSGTADRHIVIYGNPLTGDTIVDQSGFVISGRSWIDFRNITFYQSSNDGIKLENRCAHVTFQECDFVDNGFNGLEIIDSDAELRGCRILINGKAGIRFSTSDTAANQMVLNNVLIAKNVEAGIDALTVRATVSFATISDNGNDGILLSVADQRVDVFNSLITYNGGFGIRRTPIDNLGGLLNLQNVDFYLNNRGDFAIDSIYRTGYLTVNPCYANKDRSDYTIGSASTLYGSALTIGYQGR